MPSFPYLIKVESYIIARFDDSLLLIDFLNIGSSKSGRNPLIIHT